MVRRAMYWTSAQSLRAAGAGRTMIAMLKLVLVGALAVSGCAVEAAERETVDLAASDAALATVARAYGIDVSGIEVEWVTSPMSSDDGTPVRGMSFGCALLVAWWNPNWTSGLAADGPAISSTAFAHEMAHCALSRLGDSDHDHRNAQWWGAGGLVDAANAALRSSGM